MDELDILIKEWTTSLSKDKIQKYAENAHISYTSAVILLAETHILYMEDLKKQHEEFQREHQAFLESIRQLH